MAVTFKGTEIGKERGKGGQNFPRPRRKAASSLLHTLDGGNRVQHSGRAADTLNVPLRCTEAQLNSIYSAVASSGTLSYSGGSRNAWLDEMSEPEEFISAGGTIWFFVTLTFFLL
jgi:hypothetical protein